MIEAVIFDWGGTLARYVDITSIDVWGEAAQRLDHDRVADLRAELYAAEERFWSRCADDQRAGTTADIVADAVTALGVDVAAQAIDHAAAGHHEAWDPHISHFDEAVEALGALRERGIRVGLLSNTHWPGQFHEALLSRDGLAEVIEVRVYTSELDLMKPHPEPFLHTMRSLGVDDPSRTVYVGDRPFDDIVGARAAGMRAVLRPNPLVPDHPVAPDATIDTLHDVVDLVDGWARRS